MDGQLIDSPILILIKADRGAWRAISKSTDMEDLVKYTRHIAEWDIPRMLDVMAGYNSKFEHCRVSHLERHITEEG